MNSLRSSSAALVVLACASLGPARAAELVVNGGFEQNGGAGSQGFTGWTSASQPGSQGGFFAQQGTKGALTPVAVPSPVEGSYAAMSDQPGPGSHVLYQDIAIPSGQQQVMLNARVFVRNAAPLAAAPASLDFSGAAPNQQARIDVMQPSAALDDVGSGVRANVFQWPASGAPGHPVGSSGYQDVSLDLTAYAGQTVRLRIAEVDNRQSLFFGVDAVSVVAVAPGALPAPTGTQLFAQGSTATLDVTPVTPAPGTTITGYVAQCTPQGGGAVVTGTSSGTSIALSGLTAGVAYSCQVAAQSGSATGTFSPPVHYTQPVTGAAVSTPGGGIAAVQLAGPGGGATSGVLESVVIEPVAATTPTLPTSDATFPFGLIAVRVSGVAAGAQVQLQVDLPGAIPQNAQYWKYGPTQQKPGAHWYPFAGSASLSGNRLTLTLTDGEDGDDDLLKNGVIVDPGGIMVPNASSSAATAVPVWSTAGWLLASLALLGAMFGWNRRAAVVRR